jgi:hypothetical protein
MVAPLRKNVDEQSTAGCQQPNAFVDPGERPLEIVSLGESILDSTVTVVFAEIEGRISEDAVYDLVFQRREEVEAICPVEQSKRC